MPASDDQSFQPPSASRRVASQLVARAPQDLVFTMRFLGESQELLHAHFRAFLTDSLARAGATAGDHPLLPFFVDSHSAEMRDFVFTGAALARPFHLQEIEALTGDAEAMLRVDIWDAIASRIEMAEARFSAGIAAVVERLRAQEAAVRPPRREP